MVQLEQNKMRKEDEELLLMPDLQEVNEQIFQIKKDYNLVILISLILSKFSIKLAQFATENYNEECINDNDKGSEDLFFIIQFIIGNMISQITIGFLNDLISVQTSWTYTWSIQIIAIFFNLVQICGDFNNIYALGQIITLCAYINNYVTGSFIIYNSAYTLNVRFNQQVLYVIIGSYVSKCLVVLLDELDELQRSTYIYLLTASFIINIFSGILISIAYSKIENIKKNQKDYQIFLGYQGVGLNLKSIFYYYFNKNIIFLIIQTFVGGLIKISSPEQLLDVLRQRQGDWQISQNYYKIFVNTQYVTAFFVYFIQKFINSSRQFISTQYFILKIIMIVSFVVYFLAFLVLQFNEYLPFIFLLIFFQILLIYQGITFIISANVTFQIMYCLQDEKCLIKCIGLGFLSFIQDLAQIIQIFDIGVLVSYGNSTLIILLSLIYNTIYLRNKQFDQIEEKIQKQYPIQQN